jgi:hypothetical protein
MPLRGPRFSGDPVLEACFNATHRMLAPENGLAVMRVQAALIELGNSVGPRGADGAFGPDTGAAVTLFKTRHGLVPNDPVVGPGTAKALDDDLFFDPPNLDPAFAEFSPSVVDHLVEPFIGRELATLIGAPLDSWRHMLGFFALNGLNASGFLTGSVARSRAEDLRAPYLAVAANQQIDGSDANDFFNRMVAQATELGNTIAFRDQAGGLRAFVTIRDEVIMGRESVVRQSTGGRAAVTLQGVLVHELNHVRNIAEDAVLNQISDTDATVYADTGLAQARSATGTPTHQVLNSFVSEICARHTHWIVTTEVAGNPFAARFLPPEKLVEATRFYFQDVPAVFDRNGYIAGINAQGQSQTYAQIARWLRVCQTFRFSDDDAEDTRTKILFGDAASVADRLAADPPLEFAEADGLFPLPNDFA